MAVLLYLGRALLCCFGRVAHCRCDGDRVLVAGSTQEARHFGSSVFLYAPVDASHRLSQVIAYLISLPSCSFVLCLCHSWFSSLSKGQRQSQRQSLGEKSVLLLLMRDDV